MKKKNLLILGGILLSFSTIEISHANMVQEIKGKEKAAFIEIVENSKTSELVEDDEEPSTEKIEEKYSYSNFKICNNSSVKTYMNYKAITNTSSKQYKFIKNNMYVDQENGLLRYNNDNEFIGVALGSSFGEIGSMYRFTLNTGIVLNLIKIEAKADNHTNNGCEQKYDKSVIEFVIDSNYSKPVFGGNNGYVANGNFNNIKEFKGKIIKIEKITINE